MTEGGMNEEWVERIAEAVVRKLDEYEQIDAIARLVLQMLDQRQTAQATGPGGGDRAPGMAGVGVGQSQGEGNSDGR